MILLWERAAWPMYVLDVFSPSPIDLIGIILITTDDRSFRSAGIGLGYRRQTDARKRWARMERPTVALVALTLAF